MDTEANNHPSRRLLIIGLAVAVVLIITITGISYVIFGNKSSLKSDDKIPTAKDNIKQALDNAAAGRKQSADNQAAIKAAIEDSKNQIKVMK